MSQTPNFVKDAAQLLDESGFSCCNTWYHGTTSVLQALILEQGLKRSGDKAMKQAAKQTMATIGNSYTESIEPVFLTPSRELAYYWACQTVRNRHIRGAGEEAPAVIEVKLEGAQADKVRPDVGAASLLLLPEGERYMAYLAAIYEACGLAVPDINLAKADRLDYLHKLGMAYIDSDIAPEALRPVDADA